MGEKFCRACRRPYMAGVNGSAEWPDGTVVCSMYCELEETKQQNAALQAELHRMKRLVEPLEGARDMEIELLKKRIADAWKIISEYRAKEVPGA